ncbi:hypothetical protein [Streptomyces hydrogenans]|uniref:hypothetical protein n=1 Tax=Streptomyces hydrogenans TaxID=1873719 RepID=UPI0034407B73
MTSWPRPNARRRSRISARPSSTVRPGSPTPTVTVSTGSGTRCQCRARSPCRVSYRAAPHTTSRVEASV